MSTADVKLSRMLNEIASTIEALLRLATDVEKVPFVLLAAPETNVQYVANVARDDGIAMLKGLLARWQAPSAPPDLPNHQSADLVVRLLAQCRAYHRAVDQCFAALADVTRGGAAEPFFPSKSPMWETVVLGKALIDEVEAAIAFSKEMSEQGGMAAPPAAERH